MQQHPKTGGVCAQMQPKRSKHNLLIYLQIFEYLTGHIMFKATEHVIGSPRFCSAVLELMSLQEMCAAPPAASRSSEPALFRKTRAQTSPCPPSSTCTQQSQRGGSPSKC